MKAKSASATSNLRNLFESSFPDNTAAERADVTANKNIIKESDIQWDAAKMKVFVVPDKLEAFIRTFLSFNFRDQSSSSSSNANNNEIVCTISSQCGICPIAVMGIYNHVKMECIVGKCICPTAFYHLALDIGEL
jgi:hypothetical protein